MSEMALKLIHQAKAEGWKKLDLGRTGIVGEVPVEIWELTELEELILSDEWWERGKGRRQTQNTGPENKISSFPARPPHPPRLYAVSGDKSSAIASGGLARLKKMILHNTQVANIQPLAQLAQLTTLDLMNTQVTDVQPLAQLAQLTKLDLSGTQVTDIQPLAQLAQLTILSISSTQVADIKPLARLAQLASLNLSETMVANIQPLAQLAQLTTLYLFNTQVADIQPLAQLAHLTILYLFNTQVADIQPLARLAQLTTLDLSFTQVADIKPLVQLTQLTTLDLGRTQVADIQPLAQLAQLATLDLSDTQVADIQPLAQLAKLTILDLSYTRVEDIQPLAQLVQLTALNLSYTKAADIQPLAQLAKLTTLDLSSTQVADIQPLKSQIEKGLALSIEDCPLSNPTYEIATQGKKAILYHWHRRDFEGALPLNEAKIILIGQGAAGKTSLVRYFFREPFSKKQLQTDGILIRKKQQALKKGQEEVLIRFWDFGGQEVMHATHKFFLTRRATYLIVLDARKDDKEVEYWMEHVQLYGGDSPVIIAINKIDENPSFALNEAGLRQKYGTQIKGIHRISCAKKVGLKELETALYELIDQSEETRSSMVRSWRLIKDEMESLSEDFVGYERFRSLCRQHGVSDLDEQNSLLRLLNDLGIALNFAQLQAYNRAVLKPEWLTLAVYRIINAYKTAEQFGEFRANEVGLILDDRKYAKDKIDHTKYPPETYEFIGEVMRVFELCYPLSVAAQQRAYMLPNLLKVEEDDGGFVKAGCAQLTIQYPGFLPPSIFPRFVVQMHPWLVKPYCWRTGVRLEYAQFEAEGLVKLDRQDRKIEIWTSGKGGRRLMEFIRDTFAGLNAEFDGLVAQELVPLEQGQFVSYQELVGYEKANRLNYFSGMLNKEFSVKDLLDGIESAQRRAENRFAVQVFVSYSPAYPEHKAKFVTHMAALTKAKKVEIWQDGKIQPGQRRESEIWGAHGKADVVVCLISPEFIDSDYCYDLEFLAAMEREERGETKVILVQVEHSSWNLVEVMAKKQFIPAKPISAYSNPNEGWDEVVQAIAPMIEEIHARINMDTNSRFGMG